MEWHTSIIQKWKRGLSWAQLLTSFISWWCFLRFTGIVLHSATENQWFSAHCRSNCVSICLSRREILCRWLKGGLPIQNIHLQSADCYYYHVCYWVFFIRSFLSILSEQRKNNKQLICSILLPHDHNCTTESYVYIASINMKMLHLEQSCCSKLHTHRTVCSQT